jgi:hypothetical protein
MVTAIDVNLRVFDSAICELVKSGTVLPPNPSGTSTMSKRNCPAKSSEFLLFLNITGKNSLESCKISRISCFT